MFGLILRIGARVVGRAVVSQAAGVARGFLTVEIRGIAKTLRGLEAYNEKMRKRQEAALIEAALLVQNEARRLVLKGPKTGRIYTRRKRIKHQASAPGEAPASDTGTLVRNIAITKINRTKLTATISALTNYAVYLEHGTKRMKPRPFLFRAVQNKRAEIVKIFERHLRS